MVGDECAGELVRQSGEVDGLGCVVGNCEWDDDGLVEGTDGGCDVEKGIRVSVGRLGAEGSIQVDSIRILETTQYELVVFVIQRLV